MKNPNRELTAIGIWLLFLIGILIFTASCAPFKSVKKRAVNTQFTEKIQVAKDSVLISNNVTKSNTATNGEIQKKSYISLMTADSLTNAKINKALRNFKFSDRSGTNSFAASYDPKTMELLLQAFIAQTESKTLEKSTDTLKDTANSKTVTQNFEQKVDSYLSKKSIPWWLYAIGIFLLRRQILSVVGFFIPGINNLKSVNDLFKNNAE